jgi:hypothetical protein
MSIAGEADIDGERRKNNIHGEVVVFSVALFTSDDSRRIKQSSGIGSEPAPDVWLRGEAQFAGRCRQLLDGCQCVNYGLLIPVDVREGRKEDLVKYMIQYASPELFQYFVQESV